MAGARGVERSGAGSPRPRNFSISAGTQSRRFVLRWASPAWMSRVEPAASTAMIREPRGEGERCRNADQGRHCDSAGAGGAPALLRGDGMRRLKDRETFPFPRFMKATSVAMRAAADGCGGGREPWTRRDSSSFRSPSCAYQEQPGFDSRSGLGEVGSAVWIVVLTVGNLAFGVGMRVRLPLRTPVHLCQTRNTRLDVWGALYGATHGPADADNDSRPLPSGARSTGLFDFLHAME